MSEIDLIPSAYRQTLARLRELKTVCILAFALCITCVVVGMVMNRLAAGIDAERSNLASQYALSEQQGEELTLLSGRRDDLLRQRDTLTRLRGGAAVTDLMMTMDRALPGGDVWFLDWSFRRAGVDSDEEQDSNGYFIVVNEKDPFSVQTHMNISGQAIDHAALSRFVRSLFGQPGVQDVRVKQTSVRRYPTHRIVDFQLAVVLQTRTG